MVEGICNEKNRVTKICKSVFSVLDEPSGFKGADTDRAWNIYVKMKKEDGKEFIDEVTVIAEKLRKIEEDRRKYGKQPLRKLAPIITYKVEYDGSYLINFKKKESQGTKPLVIDYNRNPIDPPIIPQHTNVQIAYSISPYTIAASGIFGVTFKLLAVRVMKDDIEDTDIISIFGKDDDEIGLSKPTPINLDDIF